MPRVVLQWKNEQQEPAKQDFTNGYALKLAFGQPAEGRMPGKIYLCLPDEEQSVVAGTFDATIRKPKRPPTQRALSQRPNGPSLSRCPAAGIRRT